LFCPPAEKDENGLGGVFGEVHVAQPPIGGGIDPGGVTIDDGAEGGLGGFLGEGAEELDIVGLGEW
jgi:hypothetical protein